MFLEAMGPLFAGTIQTVIPRTLADYYALVLLQRLTARPKHIMIGVDIHRFSWV